MVWCEEPDLLELDRPRNNLGDALFGKAIQVNTLPSPCKGLFKAMWLG